MAAPWYVYVIGILCALPTYILIAALAVMLIRLFFEWMFPPPPQLSGGSKGKAR